MRNTLTRISGALLLALALAACTDPITMPEATVEGVSGLSADGSFTVDGSGFYQYPDGPGMRVEVCGVTVDAAIVDPASAEILLPPAGVIKVQTGERLTVTLPAGVDGGSGDLRVIRPDGQVTVIEGAITCPTTPTPDPEPEPEPEPEPVPTVAALNASPTEGVAPLSVYFTALGTSGQGPLTYAYDFGDGTTRAPSYTIALGHTYTEPGVYTATLTVANKNGQSDTATQVITVLEPEPEPPTAKITYSVSHPIEFPAYASVVVSGLASTDPDGQELTYDWRWESPHTGDEIRGITPTLEGQYIYGMPWRLKLTVTNEDGLSDTTGLTLLFDPPESVWDGYDDPRFADVTRLSWYEVDGATRLEVEGVHDLALIEPGASPTCFGPVSLSGDVSPLAGSPAPAVLNGWVGLDTDRDPFTGVNFGEGLPGFDYAIIVEDRNADGAFPIVDATRFHHPCEPYDHTIVGWADASVQDGIVTFAFVTPDGAGSDFDTVSSFGAFGGAPFLDQVPDFGLAY